MLELLRVFVFPSHTSNLMSRFVKDAVKVLSQTLRIFLDLFLRMAPASLQPSSATFLSTDQLSHHSHFYPPSPAAPSMTTTTSPLDDPLSRSLTFSLRLIPLTMHVPKTDLIFFRGATPTVSPTPPAPPNPIPSDSPAPAYLPNPNLVPSSCPSPPSHLPIAPPRAPPMAPPSCPPRLEFGGVCHRTVHQSRALRWYKTLSVRALICSFCQSSSPELESATLQGEVGGPRVKTAAKPPEVKERG